MSDNSNTFYNAPANLKSKVWKRFGFYKEGHLEKSLAISKVCRTANKYSGSMTNLKTYLVRRRGENYAGNEDSVDANVSNVSIISKNTQDNDMTIKDFFQPQLSHNLVRSKVNHGICSPFHCEGLMTLRCGWDWWLSRHGKVSNATIIELFILIYNGKWMSTLNKC